MRHTAVVYGKEHGFAAVILPERHIAAKPAFQASTLIVITAGALAVILFTVFEAINIELPHIAADLFEVFDQFAVGHVPHLLVICWQKPDSTHY